MRDLLLGFVAGGVLAGVLAWRQSKQLKARGAAATEAFQGRGSALEALLSVRGEELQRDLQRAGQEYAPSVADRAARAVLADSYGLTEARINAMARLGARLGG